MAGILIFSPIFFIILLLILQSCSGKTSYENYERKMVLSAERYFKKNKLLPSTDGNVVSVSLNSLVKNGYLNSPEKSLNDPTCTGKVTVRKNGEIIQQNKGGFLNYVVTLSCKKYQTNTISNTVKKDLTTTGEGLYYVDGEYIYKGERPKNYVNFYGKEYRIMGITSSGLVKLIRTDVEPINRVWDNKYNTDTKHTDGKTIYADSLILQYLISDYNNNKKFGIKSKKHIVANDICIGKRAKSDTKISKTTDCQEVLPNQVLSIMTVSDYMLASTDSECNSTVSKSCNNYNYLHEFASTTWTTNSVSDNSYEVFYLVSGVVDAKNAKEYNEYNIILYIDENEQIESGIGTQDEPYIIKRY